MHFEGKKWGVLASVSNRTELLGLEWVEDDYEGGKKLTKKSSAPRSPDFVEEFFRNCFYQGKEKAGGMLEDIGLQHLRDLITSSNSSTSAGPDHIRPHPANSAAPKETPSRRRKIFVERAPDFAARVLRLTRGGDGIGGRRLLAPFASVCECCASCLRPFARRNETLCPDCCASVCEKELMRGQDPVVLRGGQQSTPVEEVRSITLHPGEERADRPSCQTFLVELGDQVGNFWSEARKRAHLQRIQFKDREDGHSGRPIHLHPGRRRLESGTAKSN